MGWSFSTCLTPLKINHEETKITKKKRKSLRALRPFVVDFHLYLDLFTMPTIFTHGAIGFTAMRPAFGAAPDRRLLLASILLPILPDADALLTPWIPYAHPFGHRGFTHSLLFAALVGAGAAALAVRGKWGHSYMRLATFFAAITASHGLFDAMTSGGLGVAFFAPFDNTRYFLPWRPIPVSPMSAAGLMTSRGLRVIRWEFALFWLFAVAAALWDRRSSARVVIAALLLIAGAIAWVLALGSY
jgi:inner membrane protein